MLLANTNLLYYLIKFQTFFNKKWYFDFFYYYVVAGIVFVCYDVFFKNFDKGILEYIFVKRVIWFSIGFSNFIKFFQTGELTEYIVYITNVVVFGAFALL